MLLHHLGVCLTACLIVSASLSEATSRQVDGCQLLEEESHVICLAKVSCAGAADAIAEIRPLFTQCAADQTVTVTTVQNAIDLFESALVFQCCIGNDLMSTLPQY